MPARSLQSRGEVAGLLLLLHPFYIPPSCSEMFLPTRCLSPLFSAHLCPHDCVLAVVASHVSARSCCLEEKETQFSLRASQALCSRGSDLPLKQICTRMHLL